LELDQVVTCAWRCYSSTSDSIKERRKQCTRRGHTTNCKL